MAGSPRPRQQRAYIYEAVLALSSTSRSFAVPGIAPHSRPLMIDGALSAVLPVLPCNEAGVELETGMRR